MHEIVQKEVWFMKLPARDKELWRFGSGLQISWRAILHKLCSSQMFLLALSSAPTGQNEFFCVKSGSANRFINTFKKFEEKL